MNRQTVHDFFSATITRLALSYLAIIMLMSISFSVVFYHASSRELGRQIPPADLYRNQRVDGGAGFSRPVNDFFENRIAEGRRVLRDRLILLNLLALIVGSLLSYLLAERTLRPIKKNMEAQEQFVSDASHELRTPLTALLTTNEVALRRKNITDSDARSIFRENVNEITKLQTLTNSLLRLARQEHEQLAVASESLQDIAAEAITRIVKRAQEKNISVNDKVSNIVVPVEKESFVQAVTIILDNAIKYSPENSVIDIVGLQQGGSAVLKIRDHGVGIPPTDLPFIFDRFYRADQSRNKEQADGFGVGLALAKKIIDQHGGIITAESQEGTGSTFTIKLPVAK